MMNKLMIPAVFLICTLLLKAIEAGKWGEVFDWSQPVVLRRLKSGK